MGSLQRRLDWLGRIGAAWSRGCARALDELASAPGEAPAKAVRRMAARHRPGIGADTLATLLANAADALRQRSLQALRRLCGTAPVTLQSGKTRRVVRRASVAPDLRNAMCHCAKVAKNRDPGLRAVCAIPESRKPRDPSIRQPDAA